MFIAILSISFDNLKLNIMAYQNTLIPFQKQTTIMISGTLLNRDPETFYNNLFFMIASVAIAKIHVYYK